MSIASELKKRAGPKVRVRGAYPARSPSRGERHVNLVLRLNTSRPLGDVFEVARLLVGAGVSVRVAKKVVDELVQRGIASVENVAVDDLEDLKRRLLNEHVVSSEIQPRSVDVKALRVGLGLSQETFAARYCIDVSTLRNWEQGRTQPDGAAIALLQIIEGDPERVLEILTCCGAVQRIEGVERIQSVEVTERYPLAAHKFGGDHLTSYLAKLTHSCSLFGFRKNDHSNADA